MAQGELKRVYSSFIAPSPKSKATEKSPFVKKDPVWRVLRNILRDLILFDLENYIHLLVCQLCLFPVKKLQLITGTSLRQYNFAENCPKKCILSTFFLSTSDNALLLTSS